MPGPYFKPQFACGERAIIPSRERRGLTRLLIKGSAPSVPLASASKLHREFPRVAPQPMLYIIGSRSECLFGR